MKPQLYPLLYLPESEKKSHLNDFLYFSKPNVNFKSLFLCSLTAALHSAAGQEMTCAGGQRFSPDFIVQTLMRRVGAALTTGCRLPAQPGCHQNTKRLLHSQEAERGWECVLHIIWHVRRKPSDSINQKTKSF